MHQIAALAAAPLVAPQHHCLVALLASLPKPMAAAPLVASLYLCLAVQLVRLPYLQEEAPSAIGPLRRGRGNGQPPLEGA